MSIRSRSSCEERLGIILGDGYICGCSVWTNRAPYQTWPGHAAVFLWNLAGGRLVQWFHRFILVTCICEPPCALFAWISGFFLAFSLRADPGPMSLWFTTPARPATARHGSNGRCRWATANWPRWSMAAWAASKSSSTKTPIWGGQPHDYGNPSASPVQLAIDPDQLFQPHDRFDHDESGNLLADRHASSSTRLISRPASLVLTFPQSSGTSNYLRSLDLNTATANVHYDYNGVTYNRDIFASAPSNHVIVLHFHGQPAGQRDFFVQLYHSRRRRPIIATSATIW